MMIAIRRIDRTNARGSIDVEVEIGGKGTFIFSYVPDGAMTVRYPSGHPAPMQRDDPKTYWAVIEEIERLHLFDTDSGLAALIIPEIGLPDGFTLHLELDDDGRQYFQIEAIRTDVCTGQLGRGRGGCGYVDPRATHSELVQMIFGLYRAYLEHEARETFTWRGRRVYGPHMDVESLWSVADHFDARPGPTSMPLEAAS